MYLGGNMKRIIAVFLIVMVVFTLPSVCYATYGDVTVNLPGGTSGNDMLNKAVGNVWETFALIIQVLSIGTVVFAGLRYMFASADKKADIKKGLIYLAFGAALVFGATTIVQFIVDFGNEII